MTARRRLDSARQKTILLAMPPLLARPLLLVAIAALPALAIADPAPAARAANTSGMRLYKAKRYADAIQELTRAIALDPSYVNARYNLACTHALLGHRDAAVAQLEWLQHSSDPAARAKLDKARNDPDLAQLRDDAGVRRLLGLGVAATVTAAPAQSIAALMAIRKSGDAKQREDAIQALGNIHDPRAIPQLIAAFAAAEAEGEEPESNSFRWGISKALELMAKEATPPLVAATHDKDPQVRRCAIMTLGKIGNADASALEAVHGALRDPEPAVRWRAVDALRYHCRDKRCIAEMTALLGDAEPAVRDHAATVLYGAKDPIVIAPLVKMLLHDDDADARNSALIALGSFARDAAFKGQLVEPAIAALRDRDDGVRARTAVIMGEMQDPRCLTALIAALKDPKPDVRRCIVDAIAQFSDERGFDAIAPLLADADGRVRDSALEAMRKHGPRGQEALIAALKDADEGVRDTAVKGLVEAPDPRAVGPLLALWKTLSSDDKTESTMRESELDDQPGYGFYLSEALRAIAARDFEPLLTAFRGSDAGVRAYLVIIFRDSKGAGAEALRALAESDSDAAVRKAAKPPRRRR
jgi:HEAT repeat protein